MFALAVMMAAFGPAAALDTSKRDFVIFLAFLFLFSFGVEGGGVGILIDADWTSLTRQLLRVAYVMLNKVTRSSHRFIGK